MASMTRSAVDRSRLLVRLRWWLTQIPLARSMAASLQTGAFRKRCTSSSTDSSPPSPVHTPHCTVLPAYHCTAQCCPRITILQSVARVPPHCTVFPACQHTAECCLISPHCTALPTTTLQSVAHISPYCTVLAAFCLCCKHVSPILAASCPTANLG